MSEYIIRTNNLNFQFNRQRKIIENLSLNVPKGSIYGFLGPNGAGKSTTMRLITGLINEQQPSIELFGKPLHQQLPSVFSKIGSIIETPTLYLHLSGVDNLRIIAAIQKIDEAKIQEILELVDLKKFQKQKAKQYSLGMKQRLAIGMALLNEPELLILDEPVNGLDPQGIVEIRELLKRINTTKGITIFISSHLLAEVEKTCTHVGIIHQGKLRFEGAIQELSSVNSQILLHISVKDASAYLSVVSQLYPQVRMADAKTLEIALNNTEEIPLLVKNFTENNIPIYALIKKGGLEDWFMNITQKTNE